LTDPVATLDHESSVADQRDIEDTYDFMDEVFRVSFGENADLTCALYDGDHSKSLLQAQRDKHEYILTSIQFEPGFRVLDIGCGFGPVLKAVREHGGEGIGLTLSRKQAAACQRTGLEAHVMDWKDLAVDTFGGFDAVVSVGAFEHFCSVDEYLAGRQDAIYESFFRRCHELLPPNGRLYLQTMMLGKNFPGFQKLSLGAERGSSAHILAVAREFFPGSWLPSGEAQILGAANSYFRLVSRKNGRLDYIQTMRDWGKHWNFTLSNLRPPYFTVAKCFAMAKLVPRFATDAGFRRKTEFIRKGYDQECFRRELADHERMVFEKVSPRGEG
jgi:cyclopropane-fatty-acyl-phospholipid synthase